jgi:P-type Cu+ transporter
LVCEKEIAGGEGERVFAEALPEGKVAEVKKLQAAGRRVAMAGHGINDAPHWLRRNSKIAMASGTDVAMEATSRLCATICAGSRRRWNCRGG